MRGRAKEAALDLFSVKAESSFRIFLHTTSWVSNRLIYTARFHKSLYEFVKKRKGELSQIFFFDMHKGSGARKIMRGALTPFCGGKVLALQTHSSAEGRTLSER